MVSNNPTPNTPHQVIEEGSTTSGQIVIKAVLHNRRVGERRFLIPKLWGVLAGSQGGGQRDQVGEVAACGCAVSPRVLAPSQQRQDAVRWGAGGVDS